MHDTILFFIFGWRFLLLLGIRHAFFLTAFDLANRALGHLLLAVCFAGLALAAALPVPLLVRDGFGHGGVDFQICPKSRKKISSHASNV